MRITHEWIPALLVPQKTGDQALGRSRGGLTTKIHALTETDGDLVHFCLTPGQSHDSPQAIRLLKGINADNVLADRAYDSNAIAEWITQHQSAVVMPSKKNRKVKRERL